MVQSLVRLSPLLLPWLGAGVAREEECPLVSLPIRTLDLWNQSPISKASFNIELLLYSKYNHERESFPLNCW